MAGRFTLQSRLESSPDTVWHAVERTALFLHVAAPLVQFSALSGPSFPEKWDQAEYRGNMLLFGIVPIGWQAIAIDFPESIGDARVLRDRGYGPMLREWEHRISVSPDAHGGTRYCDELRFDSGWMAPLIAPSIRLFFAHRQRRLRALDKEQFAALGG